MFASVIIYPLYLGTLVVSFNKSSQGVDPCASPLTFEAENFLYFAAFSSDLPEIDLSLSTFIVDKTHIIISLKKYLSLTLHRAEHTLAPKYL